MKRDVKAARERCHKDFKGCAREVLDGGLGQEVPMFSDDDAITFFNSLTAHLLGTMPNTSGCLYLYPQRWNWTVVLFLPVRLPGSSKG